jgi:hypothetical protein
MHIESPEFPANTILHSTKGTGLENPIAERADLPGCAHSVLPFWIQVRA